MFKKYQLKNGLKVLLVESHKSPVLSIQMWVKTGSADEKKGEEGISHFIEHLVFKGTRKFKVGEIYLIYAKKLKAKDWLDRISPTALKQVGLPKPDDYILQARGRRNNLRYADKDLKALGQPKAPAK